MLATARLRRLVPYALEFAADERRSFSAPMRYHASASTPLAFLRRALPPCRTNSAIHDFTADRSASKTSCLRSWKASLTAVQSMKWLYLPQLVISPDSHNIDLLITQLPHSPKSTARAPLGSLEGTSAFPEVTPALHFPEKCLWSYLLVPSHVSSQSPFVLIPANSLASFAILPLLHSVGDFNRFSLFPGLANSANRQNPYRANSIWIQARTTNIAHSCTSAMAPIQELLALQASLQKQRNITSH